MATRDEKSKGGEENSKQMINNKPKLILRLGKVNGSTHNKSNTNDDVDIVSLTFLNSA